MSERCVIPGCGAHRMANADTCRVHTLKERERHRRAEQRKRGERERGEKACGYC